MWEQVKIEKRMADAVSWLQEQVRAAHMRGLICGLSGGVDSSVAAGLCRRAFPENAAAVIMPCHSAPEDRADALLAAEYLDLNVIEIDLTATFDTLISSLNSYLPQSPAVRRLITGNAKARLRMTTLYALAASNAYLVVGSDNAAENYTGYFTKYGDGGADILPIKSLTKTEVRLWGKALGLPPRLTERTPTAGLWPGQTDEEELGFGYDLIDRYLLGFDIEKTTAERIEYLHRTSEHKRREPAALELPNPFRN